MQGYSLCSDPPAKVPAGSRGDGLGLHGGQDGRRPNLSEAAQRYLDRLGAGVEDLFHHVLAVLHDPAYREANAGALRMEWPRIPLPGWLDGDTPGAADELAASAARGRELAALLDSDTPVPGVMEGSLRPEAAIIAVPSTADGGNMTGDDFALTAGWGHFGQGEAVMPGQGRVVERPYTADERVALGEAIRTLGATTFDVHLNDLAYWRNVPAAVWGYKLGGYQVLKKWLSYRERGVLGRALKPEEVQHFTDTARRIGAILYCNDFSTAVYTGWRIERWGGPRRLPRGLPAGCAVGQNGHFRAGWRPVVQASEQPTERLLGVDRTDWRAFVVPDVPRDDVPSAAGTGGSHLHRVLEVRHRQLRSVTDTLCIGGRHCHEAGQFDNEFAGAHPATRRSYDVIEVRDGVPSDVRALCAVLNPVQELRSRAGVRTPVEGDVDEHVGVQEYHWRYFSASAS